jgi:predicted naringenin-chalcone synthase
MDSFLALNIPKTSHLITWRIRECGFDMHLSGKVPGELCRADALSFSREVLAQYGNMSSATVMFVLKQVMQHAREGQRGCAMSFGPGVTAETMLFHAA